MKIKSIKIKAKKSEYPIRIYDSKNNQIYFENSDGHWMKQEYDSNGNQTYFEDLTGSWYKIEYDSNGNQIYFENSTGYWTKNEYDSNNNLIYYENSAGYVEDNRPKPAKEMTVSEIIKKLGYEVKIIKD